MTKKNDQLLKDVLSQGNRVAPSSKQSQSLLVRDAYIEKEKFLIEKSIHPGVITYEDYKSLEQQANLKGFVPINEIEDISIDVALDISIKILETLDHLWKNDIIYNGLSPSTILYSPDSKVVKLINFSNSTDITIDHRHDSTFLNLDTIVHFQSPEHSGRMNKSVDYRSDIYSLGTILFYLCTKQYVFNESKLHQVVHAHITKKCRLPSTINPDIPTHLDLVIEKMLSKNPEERYQTAFGLRFDLSTIQDIIYNEVHYAKAFTPGSADHSKIFEIPQKLYGREKEIINVMNIYEEVIGKPSKLLLINGLSGIGKTALVNEVKKPITEHNGLFISGKFDQLRRSIPFSGFISSLNHLLDSILSQDANTLARWKEKISYALDDNASFMVDILPRLEIIIGPQKKPELDLSTVELQNILNKTIKDFLEIFKDSKTPLVLFLDDLQWADNSTINLIKYLMSDTNDCNLLLITGYRDNEVGINHPFYQCISDLKEIRGKIDEISLANLSLEDIGLMVSETLSTSQMDVIELSKLIQSKTHGNPFFTKNILKSFNLKGFITYDEKYDSWSFSLDDINSEPIANNLVSLLIEQFNSLDEDDLFLLQRASIFGAQFDSTSLTEVFQIEAKLFFKAIKSLIEKDFIIPLDQNYKVLNTDYSPHIKSKFKFSHDKIQQAAYESIDDSQRTNAHKVVADYLYLNKDSVDIFDLVFHYNTIIGKIEFDKNIAIELNYKAGVKAYDSAAFLFAKDHFEIAYNFLPENSFSHDYENSFAIASNLSECYYLCAETDKAEKLYLELQKIAKDKKDKAKIYEIQMNYYTNQGKADEAIRIGSKALKLYGINFPQKATMTHVAPKLLLVKAKLLFTSNEDLLNNKPLTNHDALSAMKILSNMSPSCFIQSPESMLLNCLHCLLLTLKHGNTDVSSYAISLMGFVEAVALSNYSRAHELVKIATKLNQKVNGKKYYAKVLFAWNNFVQFYHAPIEESIPWLRKGHLSGINCGDFNFANYCLYSMLSREIYLGYNLNLTYKNAVEYSLFSDSISDQYIIPMMQIMRRFLSRLTLEYHPLFESRDLDFEIETFKEKYVSENDKQNISWLYIYESIFEFLTGNIDDALKYSLEAQKHAEEGTQKQIILFDHYLYSCLIGSQYHISSSDGEMAPLAKSLAKKNLKALKEIADVMPKNFRSRYYLANALFESAFNKDSLEIDFYFNRAISYAQSDNYPQITALSKMMFAYYLEKRNYIESYLENIKGAIDIYENLGARCLVNKLTEDYQKYQSLNSENHVNIDVLSTISNVISHERDISKLLASIVKTSILYSDSSSGALIAKETGLSHIEGDSYQSIDDLPKKVIDYVYNSGETLRFSSGLEFNEFAHSSKGTNFSCICLPLKSASNVIAVLYLENREFKNIFTKEKTQILEVIISQMSTILENSFVFNNLEEIIAERTKELKDRTDKLEEFSKEKETLIRVLCHDLANLVTATHFSLKQIARFTVDIDNPRLHKNYEKIDKSLKSQAYIINNVREIERVKNNMVNVNLSRVELRSAIQVSIDTFEDLALSKKITINLDEKVNDLYILADEIPLSVNIINNVLSNALKFSFPETTINIDVVEVNDKSVKITISDRGTGIPKEKQSSLLSSPNVESTRGTNDERGSGFGLSLMSFYASKMNISISIKSKHIDDFPENHGTAVTLEFNKIP